MHVMDFRIAEHEDKLSKAWYLRLKGLGFWGLRFRVPNFIDGCNMV